MVVHSAFWRVASRAVLGPEGSFLNWSEALGYVVPGSVCEEHIDDLSQFGTNTSRIQLFQDAALIGKSVKEGTAKLRQTCLANRRSWQTTNP